MSSNSKSFDRCPMHWIGHVDGESTELCTFYIGFFLEITSKSFKMIFKLIEGGVDVAFGIVRATKSNIDDVVSIFLSMPTS